MAKKEDYSYLPPALRPADEETKAKQRYQRQQVRSSRRQQEARKREKARSRAENIKQAIKDVRESDAFQVGAMVVGRGRSGSAKVPAFKPKKLSGNVKFLGARKSSTRPSGRSTPSTRKLYKEKAKADAASGYGSVTTPAGKEAQAASSKLSAKIAERKKGRTFKVKKKDEAPAKGKRTKMTRKFPGKAPSMGAKTRTRKGIGGHDFKTVLRPITKRQAAQTAQYRREALKDQKSYKGKKDRLIGKDPIEKVRSEVRSDMVQHSRKRYARGLKTKRRVDAGERIYGKGSSLVKLKPDSTPKVGKEGPSPKAKFDPDAGGAHLGGPKVKVPKSSRPKKKYKVIPEGRAWRNRKKFDEKVRTGRNTSSDYKLSPKRTAGARERAEARIKKAGMSSYDMKNRIGPVMPGSAHFGKLSPKEFAAYRASLEGKSAAMIRKSMKSKPGLTKAQKAILLGAAAAGAVGKAKRNAVKDRARSVMMAKKKALSKNLPKEVKATKIDSAPAKPIKKRRRKETAAQKNKRLNIRFKSAGQRQAERYPSKEK